MMSFFIRFLFVMMSFFIRFLFRVVYFFLNSLIIHCINSIYQSINQLTIKQYIMHNFTQSFLRILLTEKGVTPVEARIVQDNAKRLYSPKRPKQKQVRIRSSSALSLDERPCRWSRADSDLSLKAPSRHHVSSRQSSAHSAHLRAGTSDISLILHSKSRTTSHQHHQTNTNKTSSGIGNAGWDKFDFSRGGWANNRASRVADAFKQQMA
jgi:hypothetical protein